ncbi:hypothetical protein [Cupriavidus sp. 8B]
MQVPAFSSSDMSTKIVAVIALLTIASFAHGTTKCRSGTKILYLNDVCPAGYTDITSNVGGTVSSIGKSETIRRQEQEFLSGRTADDRKYKAQIAQEQQQILAVENSRRADCNALASQTRSVEIQMRQINAWQWMDNLKQQHRNLRDQQYRLGC